MAPSLREGKLVSQTSWTAEGLGKYINVCMCGWVDKYAYTHLYVCIHTQRHTHTHMYIYYRCRSIT